MLFQVKIVTQVVQGNLGNVCDQVVDLHGNELSRVIFLNVECGVI